MLQVIGYQFDGFLGTRVNNLVHNFEHFAVEY